jgi:hypothetical protein
MRTLKEVEEDLKTRCTTCRQKTKYPCGRVDCSNRKIVTADVPDGVDNTGRRLPTNRE